MGGMDRVVDVYRPDTMSDQAAPVDGLYYPTIRLLIVLTDSLARRWGYLFRHGFPHRSLALPHPIPVALGVPTQDVPPPVPGPRDS